MVTKRKTARMPQKILRHLRKDTKEFKRGIKEDRKLARELKKVMAKGKKRGKIDMSPKPKAMQYMRGK